MKKQPVKKPGASRSRAASKKASRAIGSESVAALKEQLEEKIGTLSVTNRHLKRKIFDLYTVFEISRNFNAVLDYHTLLDSFIFTCLGQLSALKGTVFLRKDGRADRFHPIKSKGSGELPHPDQFICAESKLAGYLTKLNRPALVDDLVGNITTPEEDDILGKFESGIVVPLIYQTRLSGVLVMAEKISGSEFTADDIEFLSILGNQIAVAIENARLYEGEKMATKQLRAAQQQLLQSEKLAALGEMSAKIAHEVNNPLGIIKNYIVLLQRAIEGNPEAREFTGIVKQEIDRIATIVKQLLEFHRPGAEPFEPVDVVEVVNDVLVLMQQQLASRNITLIKDFPSERQRVQGSAENLKQVFLNLIINARDAMDNGGELKVSVIQEEEKLYILFSDTGPGIPAELIPRIFEPFFTTKEPGEGTGLGLSVCYGIIKNHCGSITFNNLDSGGCFKIQLPISDEKRTDDTSA